jgi:hypothetical protein
MATRHENKGKPRPNGRPARSADGRSLAPAPQIDPLDVATPPVDTRFDRLELKFAIGVDALAGLYRRLSSQLDRDRFSDAEGGYIVDSVYYDSPGYDAYFERARGITPRHKVRLRVYGFGTPDEAAFVEIKTKLRRRVVKRRLLLPFDEAISLCHGNDTKKAVLPAERLLVDDVRRMVSSRAMAPVMHIRYRRSALLGTGSESGLRVTADTAIGYRTDLVENLGAAAMEGEVINPAQALLEVKVNDVVPFWLAREVTSSGAQIRPFSKYCRALETSGLIEARTEAPEYHRPSPGGQMLWNPSSSSAS